MIVGIAGSGIMGAGIAQVALMAGCEVHLFDAHPKALRTGGEFIVKRINRLVEKERISRGDADEMLPRLRLESSLDAFATADLVIEAIIEDIDIKKDLFRLIEKVISDTCILATNTSSLSVAALAAACDQPERVIGLHFFNPAPLMKLVEIIPAVQSRPGLVAEMKALMMEWGKTPVVAKDTPAFIVNRIARPFYGEALRIYDEGIADFAEIDASMKTLGGFRMGPFELMDFIGNDINYKVTTAVFEAFFYDPRYKPSFTQKRLLDAGFLGVKTGRGFYDYADHPQREKPVVELRKGKAIVDRIVAMLINEAVDALFWGVASAEDIEAAMTKGVNYPKGLLAWADEWGPARVLAQLQTLYDEYGEDRYRVSPLLRKKVRQGEPMISEVPVSETG